MNLVRGYPQRPNHWRASPEVYLNIINPLEYPGWDDLLPHHANATIFHTSHWARVLIDAFGYKPFYYCLFRQNRLAVLIPVMEINSRLWGRRAKTLPFTDYCPVLAVQGIDSQALVNYIVQYGQRQAWKTYELRGGVEANLTSPPFSLCYGHDISIQRPSAAIFADFRSSSRRNIRRALKMNVKIVKDHSSQSVKEYYRLHCLTRKRQGLFPQPYKFFSKIREHILAPGHGFLSLAHHGGECIAGAIYFHFNKKAVFAHGASDKRYSHLRPNNLLIWDAIKWHARQGHVSFSMGITDESNAGLRRYKQAMTQQERRLYFYKYNCNHQRALRLLTPSNLALRNLRLKICKIMPMIVLRTIGNILYEHHG